MFPDGPCVTDQEYVRQDARNRHSSDAAVPRAHAVRGILVEEGSTRTRLHRYQGYIWSCLCKSR